MGCPFWVTVYSHIHAGRFHARMKICLHECAKGAPRNEQKSAAQAAESHEVAVLRMARVNCNKNCRAKKQRPFSF